MEKNGPKNSLNPKNLKLEATSSGQNVITSRTLNGLSVPKFSCKLVQWFTSYSVRKKFEKKIIKGNSRITRGSLGGNK